VSKEPKYRLQLLLSRGIYRAITSAGKTVRWKIPGMMGNDRKSEKSITHEKIHGDKRREEEHKCM
jgi:hypothetical protein